MLQRQPEPEIIMETAASVAAFDAAGAPGGPLRAIYLANTRAAASHVPKNGVVLDLFCGSGQVIAHLLEGRPDLTAVGVDLSEAMLRRAEERLRAAGFWDRVQLVRADASTVVDVVLSSVSLITSLSALHHCPRPEDLRSVLEAIRAIHERDDSAVWLFDLVRPPDESLLRLIPKGYEISARTRLDPAFRQDWTTSLAAGWTFDEFRDALADVDLELVSTEADYSQLHHTPVPHHGGWPSLWIQPETSEDDHRRAESLSSALSM